MPFDMFNMSLAFTVLITGIIVVFSVLIILTFAIKAYGSLVRYISNKKSSVSNAIGSEKLDFIFKEESKNNSQDAIIAAISAAVAYIYSGNGEEYRIKSIRRSNDTRSNWRVKGLFDNTKLF